ncbi:MAG TPA: amino acid adenylation domain-containing protein, partial [Blastocatellia bacterium]|nr:amino acid adenylation domain-containing protein [Blastocatellia bacterium]
MDLAKAEDFWRNVLKGFTGSPALVIGRKGHRGSEHPEHRGEQRLSLPEDLTSALNAFSQRNHLTLNSMFQGVWGLLLSRYTGEDDIVFGALRACRRSALDGRGGLGIAGPFINTVPVRLRIRRSESVVSWLKGVRELWVAMRDYENTPLAKIQGWTDLSGNNSLFESILTFENRQMNNVLDGGEGRRTLRNVQALSPYPLTIAGFGESECRVIVHYDLSRFDDEAIERMLNHMRRLFERIVECPERPVGNLPVLTEEEERRILIDWNDTSREYPDSSCLPDLVEEWVERAPGSVAVAIEDQSLSYGELNRRANQLAHYLRRQGVGLEDRVGICLDRSLEMIVALLGVLKAGGVYVPLDPSYPSERLAFIGSDAQLKCSLSLDRMAQAAAGCGVMIISIDGRWQEIRTESDQNPARLTTAENLAYISYTSGSTGRPKGVEVSHRAIVRLVREASYVKLDETSVVFAAAPLAFDASTFEIWGGLLNGGRCVLAPEGVPVASDLERAIKCHGVNTMWLTASLFNSIVEERPNALEGVDQLLVGGEVLSPRHVRIAQQSLTRARIINGYGPTEGTTFTCCWPIPAATDGPDQAIPIGHPISNSTAYILDRYMDPVPLGLTGELHAGGAGVARGYLNRADLTAEGFVPDPFTDRQGGRLYKTGDRVRYLEDGRIEYLSREDDQVKVRGFRIELGEIEAAIMQHWAVRECAVVVQEEPPGEKRVAAYIAAVPNFEEGIVEFRSYLRGKLPGYMIPSLFIAVDSLPFLPSGKVDRRALAAAAAADSRVDTASGPPATAVEEVLTAIWAEVLKQERIGLDDDFFQMGGHSLVATQLMTRIRRAFRVDLALRRLFELPTIKQLAKEIELRIRDNQGVEMPAINRAARDRALPLSYPQERMWLYERLEPNRATYNIPLGLRFAGRFDVGAVQLSLNEILRRHEILRTRFASRDGEPIQIIDPVPAIRIAEVDLTGHEPEDRETMAANFASAKAHEPFDLS